ncbi:MAG: M28 family peptidase [Bryobacteraceae bacterium]
MGPRTVESDAHRKTQAIIVARAKAWGCELEEDSFTAQTPNGSKAMKNLIMKRRGTSDKLVVLSGHYDTKVLPGFTGANDGGSSTGLLLELARVICRSSGKNDVWMVWLDGEEAFRQWSDADSLYGSRRLAARWAADGTAKRTIALINVDMIGDQDLRLMYEWNSTAGLRNLVWQTAGELGFSKHFSTQAGAIEDDHIPFLRAGIPSLDLIDFDFGPNNSYWHTEKDTVDKLSAESFQVVGEVLLRVLTKLEN